MTRIILDVLDDRKAEPLILLLRGLSYVEMRTDGDLKLWGGGLKGVDNPITVGDFRIYSRDELHEP